MMDMDEVKSLLPDHLKSTNDKIIQTEVDNLSLVSNKNGRVKKLIK